MALSPRMQPLFQETKRICFGQFIVEVPSTSTVVYGPADVGFPIEYHSGEAHRIETYVTAQIAEFEKDRIFIKGSKFAAGDSLFGKVTDGEVPGQKLVFGTRDHATYSVDSFIPVGKDLFIQHGDGIPKDDAIKILNKAARLLRLRSDDEVPAEPGVCLEGGFVAWQPEFERASIGVRLKEFPDVHFSVAVVKNQDYLIESEGLERRLDAAKEGGNWYSRIKFFRRGPRQLGNWTGFEVLARKPAQEHTTESHEFAFVSLGAVRDSLLPELDIKLDTGVKDDQTASVTPSITDEEAVALWDKLVSTIRVRPTGEAAKKNSAPKVPLGAHADSGSPCPASGWWECRDNGLVIGGRRRHVVMGEPMPNAVLLDKRDIWQKITGEHPTREAAAAWELIEHDPLPYSSEGTDNEHRPTS